MAKEKTREDYIDTFRGHNKKQLEQELDRILVIPEKKREKAQVVQYNTLLEIYRFKHDVRLNEAAQKLMTFIELYDHTQMNSVQTFFQLEKHFLPFQQRFNELLNNSKADADQILPRMILALSNTTKTKVDYCTQSMLIQDKLEDFPAASPRLLNQCGTFKYQIAMLGSTAYYIQTNPVAPRKTTQALFSEKQPPSEKAPPPDSPESQKKPG